MLKDKKIVHLVSGVSGGAGIAAIRLHEALLEKNIDSSMLFLHGTENASKKIYQYIKPKEYRLKNKVIRGLYKLLGLYKEINELKGLKGKFEVITTPKTFFRVENHPLVQNADIVHLHWISNFVNYPTFFQSLLSKKIVWTLHDMNPFLGCFHYKGDRSNNAHLGPIEDRLSKLKKKAIGNINPQNLKIICPSQWMLDNAQKSKVFDGELLVVPNIYDSNKIDSNQKKATNKKVLLYASQYLSNARKRWRSSFRGT